MYFDGNLRKGEFALPQELRGQYHSELPQKPGEGTSISVMDDASNMPGTVAELLCNGGYGHLPVVFLNIAPNGV